MHCRRMLAQPGLASLFDRLDIFEVPFTVCQVDRIHDNTPINHRSNDVVYCITCFFNSYMLFAIFGPNNGYLEPILI